MKSPLGDIAIYASEVAVYEIKFLDDNGAKLDNRANETGSSESKKQILEDTNAVIELCKRQLNAYFNGENIEFDFPILPQGTPFQQRVWTNLCQIPAGTPISYARLSALMKQPLAIRAIANANARNKLAIVIPCHRVIGSSGDLVGYAGGLWRKKWLLEHEAKVTHQGQTLLF